MKIGIVCVNYLTDTLAQNYCRSIFKAFKNFGDGLDIHLCVVNVGSSTTHSEFETLRENFRSKFFKFDILSEQDNLGYLGGASKGIDLLNKTGSEHYDFIAISNVDLNLKENFFIELKKLGDVEEIGIIAPSVLSEKRKVDLNPKMLLKPKKWKIFFNYMSTHSTVFFQLKLLQSSFYNLLRSKRNRERVDQDIYAPHGAFILLTRHYIKDCLNIKYPVFLFGEEMYFAEECKSKELKVRYYPNLCVYDFDHGSTGKKAIDWLRQEFKKSYAHILRNYY